MGALDDRAMVADDGLGALRRRLSTDERFRYRKHELFTTIFTTPLTIEMVLGDHADALRTIVNAVRELHGDDVEFMFDTDGSGVAFSIQKWREEAYLQLLDTRAGETP